jgi:NOL1/NOP2/fmu family ribosome biogenesis protein
MSDTPLLFITLVVSPPPLSFIGFHPRRVWELAENLERWGARNAVITNESPERLADHFGAWFDRVLLDAPCSGEGMFRKTLAARLEWSPELVRSCAVRQTAILESAVRLVRQGGWLAYSTCTFAPEENEATIARLLEAHPDFELFPGPDGLAFAPGRPDWLPDGLAAQPGARDLALAARLWPNRLHGEGHFVARLRRIEGPAVSVRAARRPAALPRPVRQQWEDFAKANLAWASPFPDGEQNLVLQGSYLYRQPAGLPELGNLKVIHPGWWLGTVKKNRFEPAHALGMGLKPEEARRVCSLSSQGVEALAYLRGETQDSPGEDGWVLVAVDGYPLGWGKRVQGRIKNAYPRGLRWI